MNILNWIKKIIFNVLYLVLINLITFYNFIYEYFNKNEDAFSLIEKHDTFSLYKLIKENKEHHLYIKEDDKHQIEKIIENLNINDILIVNHCCITNNGEYILDITDHFRKFHYYYSKSGMTFNDVLNILNHEFENETQIEIYLNDNDLSAITISNFDDEIKFR